MDDQTLIIIVIGLALVFDFINGFHDSANAVATVVSTKVLSARAAIIMAAVLNFGGALVTTGVAKSIASDIVQEEALTLPVLAVGLGTAIAWNLATWLLAIPSSSSHALVGGLAGAAVAGHGFAVMNPGGLTRIMLGLFLSPLVGAAAGYIAILLLKRVTAPPKLQILSAAAVAFGHGSNDAQKTMGVITAALLAFGEIEEFYVPGWVVVAAALVMGIGTAAGGWRITKTMGEKIVKLTPTDGLAAESSAAVVVGAATFLKLPVSTTHVIAASIAAVGVRKGAGQVHWQVVKGIAWAMLGTVPVVGVAAVLVGLLCELLAP